MVKFLSSIALTVFLASCSRNDNASSPDQAFDTANYLNENFKARVKSFLDARPETASLAAYQAIFVNTEGCAVCATGVFNDCASFLEKTAVNTIIYVNDSSLIKLAPANSKIAFVVLPSEDYKQQNVFHNTPYLYVKNGSFLKSIHLNAKASDSLNAL